MFAKLLVRIWGLFLLKINQVVVKKILLGIVLIIIGMYFFQDWEDYFSQIIAVSEDPELISLNLDKLFYIKISKYIFLSALILWIFYNLFSLSFSKQSKENKKLEKDKIKKQEIAEESINNNEDYFDSLEDIDLHPDLKTKAEKILEEDK